ncbi:hypothetical protein GQ53DRAFT_463498 [Thozetella sp. PMI_491]|nr:hypothetical protein GQ53DRAFT_463498 [Thozetella sp. PMI_491]
MTAYVNSSLGLIIMELSVEAIVTILGLFVALPPSMVVLFAWLRRRQPKWEGGGVPVAPESAQLLFLQRQYTLSESIYVRHPMDIMSKRAATMNYK